MTQLRVAFMLFAFIYCLSQSAITIDANPLDENDSAQLMMKIEKVNEQLPGVQAKQKDNTTDQPKLKKSQRNYPVYYVNTKVNGQFGRGMSVRSLNIDKFENVPLITV